MEFHVKARRVAPMLEFEYDGVEVSLHAVRQDTPPKLARIDYAIRVRTSEPDRRLDLLHDNVRKFGTVFNTVAPGTTLDGALVRADDW